MCSECKYRAKFVRDYAKRLERKRNRLPDSEGIYAEWVELTAILEVEGPLAAYEIIREYDPIGGSNDCECVG